MLFSPLPLLALAATSTTATKLYISSYAGNITTLDLTSSNSSDYKLTLLASTPGCGLNASWLQLDKKHNTLFCLDENIVGTNGSLSSFKIDPSKNTLSRVGHSDTLIAPVNSAIYSGSNGSQLMAVAHYNDAISTWKIDPVTAHFTLSQTFNFSSAFNPGPDTQQRQLKPHPHQVVLDPTNRYFLVPDLGADLVRVFYVNPSTLSIQARDPIPVTPGSGPRHGVFKAPTALEPSMTYFYLVTELANTVAGYSVNYIANNGGITLNPIAPSIPTFGPGNEKGKSFVGNAAAEVAIAPDGNSLLISNRNATFFSVANPDPKNSMRITSDSLATFAIEGDGKLNFEGLSPAGGTFPRNFALNKDGSLVAVGLQTSGRVAVYERCATTGRLGLDMVANFEGLGNVTSVVWAEGK